MLAPGHDRVVLVEDLALCQAYWDVVVKGILSLLVWSLDESFF